MKGTLVLLIFLMMASIALAQTNSGTWALTANGNCVTVGSLTGTPITRANPGTIPPISYGASGANSNTWNIGALAVDRYYQYTLTASANVTITNFSMILETNHNNMHGAIRYSLDGFSTYTVLLADYSFGGPNPYTFTNAALSIPMTSGQTMTVRVYAWNANAANKLFYNRNLVISGTRQTTATDYFRTKAIGNWNQTSTWESSGDGVTWVNSTLTPTATANTTTINHAVTLTTGHACGNLHFTGGSIDHGNNNLTITGSLTGAPNFIYSGIGVPSQTGTISLVTVTTLTPTSLPATLNTLTVVPGVGNSMILPNNVNTTNLAFTNGSITLGNYQIVVSGNTTGTSLFIYNGTGGISGSGASNVNTVLGVNTSSTIPPIVNTIDVNPGIGNIAELPNDVTTTILTFTNGSLSFNGHLLTLANKDFAITGTQTIAGLVVTLSSESHTYEGSEGIHHTWQTSGTVAGTVDITLFYPATETTAGQVRVYNRNHIVGESIWSLVGTLNTVNHGTYYSVTVPGVTAMNGRGDLDWTISDIDDTLPVELASFTASLTFDGNITLNWITHSETDVLGYHVFRNTENMLSTANCLTQALIPATNTSYTHNYSFTDHEVGTDHVIYYYWLQYTEFSGATVLSNPVTIEVNNNNGTPSVIPPLTSLQTVFPNPFKTSATIRYGLKTGDKVSIEVYNVKGQLVNKLVSGIKDAGTYDITWNGTDLKGTKCGSGVYYIVMNTNSVHNIQKMIKF